MNLHLLLRGTLAAAALLATCGAGARNVGHMLPVAAPLAAARAGGEVAGIGFAFGSASAHGAQILGGTVSVQGVGSPLAGPHGFKPTDDEACGSVIVGGLPATPASGE